MKNSSSDKVFWPGDGDEQPPWTTGFIEAALNGIISIHLNYSRWSISQDFKKDEYNSDTIYGHGVALADEVTVCSAITQEYLSSRSSFGGWINKKEEYNIEGGPRYRSIRREVVYDDADKKQRVDIEINRVSVGENGTKYVPVYIEAKRAYRWPTKLLNAEVDNSNVICNSTSVKDDIEKLNKYHNNGKYYGYVLFWNLLEPNYKSDVSPSEYMKNIDFLKPVVVRQIRWTPLPMAEQKNKNSIEEYKECNRWIWVVLAEVTEILEEQFKPDGYSW